ncbi:hypothetical protein BH23GEM7_BH23GEM7_29340 [soil metagenome]
MQRGRFDRLDGEHALDRVHRLLRAAQCGRGDRLDGGDQGRYRCEQRPGGRQARGSEVQQARVPRQPGRKARRIVLAQGGKRGGLLQGPDIAAGSGIARGVEHPVRRPARRLVGRLHRG